jgi:hypothetical protein
MRVLRCETLVPDLSGTDPGACALSEKQRDESFQTAISHYTKAIRWGDCCGQRFRRPEDPAIITPPPPANNPGHCLRAGANLPSASGNESAVTVRITYYRDDGMTLKTLIDQQSWEYAAAEILVHHFPPPMFK